MKTWIMFALAIAGVPLLPGCGQDAAEFDARIDKRISERLVAEGLVKPPVPVAAQDAGTGARKAEKGDPPEQLSPVALTHRFLTRLDELMKGYEPELGPDVTTTTGNTNLLRCLTTEAMKNDPALSEASDYFERRREETRRAAEKSRGEARRMKAEFRIKVLPLNYRIDYGWQERLVTVPPTFGCFNKSSGSWDKVTRSECESEFTMVRWWTMRSPGGPVEPAQPIYKAAPELMRRMEAAGVVAPARISCLVEDVLPIEDRKEILCEDILRVRLHGGAPHLNIGDTVSVPIVNVKRDPNGVLWKDISEGTWVADAETATVTVDEPAVCPSVEEILAASQDGR